MKCNIKSSYIEITIPQFLVMYPKQAAEFAQHFNIWELLEDDNYVVRVAADGRIEFGYKDDEWMIT